MLRNCFFALSAVLVMAASSNATIMLSTTGPTDVGNGLQSFILHAHSDDPVNQTIVGVGNPSIVAGAGSSGLSQVWLAVTNSPTPTVGDQAPPLWSDTWKPFDSFWNFNATNSLSIGAAFTETNSGTGGPALPSAGFGAPMTGFGTMGTAGGADGAKSFTIASGLQGTDVDLGQFVLKTGQSALASLTILTGQGNNQSFQNFMIGGSVVAAPVVNSLLLVNNTLNATVSGNVTATNGGALGPATLGAVSYTPGFGAAAGAPGSSVLPTWDPATGAFSWNTATATRGTYVWNVNATNGGGTGLGTITVEQHAVPEPATLALLGLAGLGMVGFARRRS